MNSPGNKDLKKTDFSEILNMISVTRNRVFRTINSELINLYWKVGKFISIKVIHNKWGKSVVNNLSEYLSRTDPTLKGFSSSNLWRMKQFYETYKDDEKLATLWRELTWSHNRIIFSRCKSAEEREFYLALSVKEKYSVRELDRQINSGIFERTMLSKKINTELLKNNDKKQLNIFRDSYVLDFLNLPEEHSESEPQKAIILSLKDFILEIGKDFSFIGQNYRLQVGNSDFYIDLLFFHRELQCLVAFELKTDKFKPEYLGQIEFYLEALDRDVRKSSENPSIGILLCIDKDDQVVEYAMSRSLSPSVITEYKTKLIPKDVLRNKLNEFYEIYETKKLNHIKGEKQ